MLDLTTKIRIVANPTAGQGRAVDVAHNALAELERRGYSVDLRFTGNSGQGQVLAAGGIRDGSKLIVAIGGDGTISEAVNGIAGTDAILAVIPGGTADVFSKEMSLPRDVSEAIDVIARGNISKIDIGVTDAGKYFLLMAGIGFDAEVVSNINHDMKRLLRDVAYPLTGLQTLINYEVPKLTLEIDGEFYNGSFAVIGNSRNYGGVFTVTTEARIDDGDLDVCIFQGTDVKSFYRYVIGVLTHTHLYFEDVVYLRTTRVKVTADRKTLVQADGELIGELPMEFTIKPAALPVIIP